MMDHELYRAIGERKQEERWFAVPLLSERQLFVDDEELLIGLLAHAWMNSLAS